MKSNDIVIRKKPKESKDEKMIGFRLPKQIVLKLELNGIEVNKTARAYLMTLAKGLK